MPDLSAQNRSEVATYPSILRRVIVIALYNIAIAFAVVVLIVVLVENICWFYNECTDRDHAVVRWIKYAWIVAAASSVILGWRGKLWGARRRQGEE